MPLALKKYVNINCNLGVPFEGNYTLAGDTDVFQVNAGQIAFTSMSFAGCTALDALYVSDYIEDAMTLDVSNCPSLRFLYAAYSGGMGPVGSFGAQDLHLSTLLQEIDFNSSGVTSLNISGLTVLAFLTLANNPGLGSLNFSSCTAIEGLDISDCSTLTTLTLPATANSLTNFSASGAALNVTAVNAMLALCDASGLSNGSFDTSGGTNAAPTGAGLTHKTSLLGKGWFVGTN